MCILFEICEKRPSQKCMGLGGVADDIFEHRGQTFRCLHDFRPQVAAKSARKHALNVSHLLIPNRHFQAGLGPHLGRHHHAYC